MPRIRIYTALVNAGKGVNGFVCSFEPIGSGVYNGRSGERVTIEDAAIPFVEIESPYELIHESGLIYIADPDANADMLGAYGAYMKAHRETGGYSLTKNLYILPQA